MTESPARPSLRVFADAFTDAKGAIRFYNQQASDLGRAFLHELTEQLRRIRQFPRSYPRIDATRRRATLQRFPFTIVYRHTGDCIEINRTVRLPSRPRRVAESPMTFAPI